MDTAAPKPGELILTECAGEKSAADSEPALEALSEFPVETLKNLWQIAEAGACGFSLGEFTSVLANVGRKHNFGLPAGTGATNRSIETFFRALHLSDLALAHACAVGRDAAWELFVRRYRAFLSQTAVAITGSPSLGQELADSLYGELYGLRELDGVRRSPFASYSGRGSLEGWLRATLVQRFRDHHRRTYRENPLDEIDCPAQESPSPGPVEPGLLAQAVARTLRDLPAESRFLLSAYFLDRQTLLQIARTLHVHEATISRRLARLIADLRKQLVINLQQDGLSRRAAEEALGADPRDVEINLRAVLQTSQIAPFSDQGAPAEVSDKI